MRTLFSTYQINALGPVCTHPTCPKRQDCLRHVVALDLMEENNDCLAECVLPNALRANGTCAYFRSAEPLSMAYGLQHFYDEIPFHKAKRIRTELMFTLGGKSMYYHYYYGQYPFTPAMQEAIRKVCDKCGYTGTLHFDQIVMEADWHSPHCNEIDK